MNKLEIPAGYRILRAGSKILPNDRYKFTTGIIPGIGVKDNAWTGCGCISGIFNNSNESGLTPDKFTVITNRPVRVRKPKFKATQQISNSNIPIPTGYRALNEGEIIEKGDKFYSAGGNWSPIFMYVTRPFNRIDWINKIVIRPIPVDNSVKVNKEFLKRTFNLDYRNNYEFEGKAIWLNSNEYNWELKKDSQGALCLIPTKKI